MYQHECVDLSKVCDFEYDCTDKSDEEMCGTCDFEKSLCGFYDKSSDRFEWARIQEPSTNPTSGEGPLTDHTYINDANTKGHFAITRILPASTTTFTRSDLWGPVMGRTSTFCKVNFWLFIKHPYSRISK